MMLCVAPLGAQGVKGMPLSPRRLVAYFLIARLTLAILQHSRHVSLLTDHSRQVVELQALLARDGVVIIVVLPRA